MLIDRKTNTMITKKKKERVKYYDCIAFTSLLLFLNNMYLNKMINIQLRKEK